jgi:hypothetical protein
MREISRCSHERNCAQTGIDAIRRVAHPDQQSCSWPAELLMFAAAAAEIQSHASAELLNTQMIAMGCVRN